jgi:polypeptide N-acetylgalactosaminyltransferase
MVRIIRSGKRLGLIRARMLGASHATAEVLTFLDSHCECNLHWAEPILALITADKQTVVCVVFALGVDHLLGFKTLIECAK